MIYEFIRATVPDFDWPRFRRVDRSKIRPRREFIPSELPNEERCRIRQRRRAWIEQIRRAGEREEASDG